MFELFLLLIVAGICYLWFSTMRARDIARVAAQQVCRRYTVQLLDQTVALRRMRLTRRATGSVAIRRQFRFDYSDNGFRRRDGIIWMNGWQPEIISMPLADAEVIETVE